MFIFPNKRAAELAVQTVKQYKEKTKSKIKEKIEEADVIIIGAGAGFSTSAGFVYNGERFEKYKREENYDK